MTSNPPRPLQPGDRAPEFTLPAADQEGTVALADYRGRAPLLLGLFRGTYCPFCRRAIVRMGQASERLMPEGVEALAIVATTPENARFYFRFRPPRLAVAADPEFVTHRLYGVPRRTDIKEALRTTRVDPTGELPAPLPVLEASAALSRLEGFEPTPTDRTPHGRTSNSTGSSLWTGRGLSAGRTSSAPGRASPGSASSRPTRSYWPQSGRSPSELDVSRGCVGCSSGSLPVLRPRTDCWLGV